jgi:hypothetical protein
LKISPDVRFWHKADITAALIIDFFVGLKLAVRSPQRDRQV